MTDTLARVRIEEEIANHPLICRIRNPRVARSAVAHAVRMATRKHHRLDVKFAVECGIQRAEEDVRLVSHDTGCQ